MGVLDKLFNHAIGADGAPGSGGLIPSLLQAFVPGLSEIDNRNYQRRLQQTIFEREDNAVQRRVADLKAAGLSPVLAAGQSANAGQTIKTEPANLARENDMLESLKNLYNQDKQVAAQVNISKAEVKNIEADTDLKKQQLKHLDIYNPSKERKLGAEASIAEFDSLLREKYSNMEMMTNSEAIGLINNKGGSYAALTQAEKARLAELNIKHWDSQIKQILTEKAAIDRDIAEQIETLGGIEILTKKILLKMTEKDYEIIEALGADKAWTRLFEVMKLIRGG